MRRRAVAAGLLLGVCCFCAALAAIAPRQSAAAAASGRRHSSYTTRQQRRFREQQPDARRLQQESSGATITEARVLVVPRFPCQLVDANETVCMASMEAATSETCLSKAMTRTASYKDTYLAPFARVAPFMPDAGVPNYAVAPPPGGWTVKSRNRMIEEAEVIICADADWAGIAEKNPGAKFVLLQSHVTASLSACGPKRLITKQNKYRCTDRVLRTASVIAYVQHSSLQPLTMNNVPRADGSVHWGILASYFVDQAASGPLDIESLAANASDQFSEELLRRKVHTLVPHNWRWRFPVVCAAHPEFLQWMTPALQHPPGALPFWLRPLAERPIDIAFSGSIDPTNWGLNKDIENLPDHLYTMHRSACAAALRSVADMYPELNVVLGEHLTYGEFAQLLRRSKIFVSPLGRGEYSGKDLEAVMSRTVLIKPLASMLRIYPNIYEPGVTCEEVAPDFSELPSVVKRLLRDPAGMQRMADAAFARVVEASDERNFAAEVAMMLQTALS